jgi:hypothetical protein
MAVLYITEFAQLMPAVVGHQGQIAMQPPLAEQHVAIGGGSVQSSAFNSQTRLVRLHADAICSIEFGTNPTATANTARMSANQTEYHGVPVNTSFIVAVITNV